MAVRADALNAATMQALNTSGNRLFVMPIIGNLETALADAAANATAANPYYIVLATASYTITSTLEISSYTTLDLNGSLLKGDAATRVTIIKNTGWDGLTANTNITIKNGSIDWNYTGRGAFGAGHESHGLKFYKVTGLRLTGLELIDIPKYGINPWLCDDVFINDIQCNTYSAAIQCCGGGSRHLITNIYGYCGDDMVAYTLSDWSAYTHGTEYRDFEHIVVNNLVCDAIDHAAFKAIGGMVPIAFTNSSIVDNLDGTYTVTTTAAHNFLVGNYVRIRGATSATYNDKWLVASVTADTWIFNRTTGLGNSTVHGTSNAQFFLADFTVDTVKGTCTNIPIKLGEDTADSYDIAYSYYKNLVIKNISGITADTAYVQIITDISNYFEDVYIEGCGRFELSSTKSFIQTSGTASPIIENLTIKNSRFLGTGTDQGTVLNMAFGTITNLILDDIVTDNIGTIFSQPVSQFANIKVYLSNAEVKNGNTGFQVRNSFNLYLSNVRHTGNSNRLLINQNAGAVTAVYGNCMDVGTDNRTVEQGGFGTIHLYGMIRAQTADVTAAAGVFFFDVTSGEYMAYDGAANSVIN